MKERENKGRGAGQNNVQSKGLLTIPLAMFFFFFQRIFIKYLFSEAVLGATETNKIKRPWSHEASI